MKNKSVRVVVLCMVFALALLVIVPTASASMVTKIQYAQENTEVFEYTAPSNGQLWIKVDWTDHLGNVTSYPISEVDAGVICPSGGNLYVDSDIKTLYSGVNGNTGTQTVSKDKKYYICVFPWLDDCTATITMKLGGSGGTNITCVRMSDGATVTSPQTVSAAAADGEFYAPSEGDFISTFQYWPGTAAEFYACWNDYIYERIAGSTFDTLAEAYAMVYYQTAAGLQAPVRNTFTAPGAPQGPHAQKWYSVCPQIWPGAAVPNVADAGGNYKPGPVSSTTAPAWYTYAYEDASVASPATGYFWGTLTLNTASRRNYSSNVSSGASFGASFSGESITWVFTKNSNCGVARVTIDGADYGTVDQYAPARTPMQTAVYNNLGAGDHTIVITNNKTTNAASSNTFINHDAFLAKGKGDASDPTPWLENNYDGATWYKWGTLSNDLASGKSYSTQVSTGAVFAQEFSGTSITWKYVTNSNAGIAYVYIDGVLKDTVDQYSSARTFGVTKTYGSLANTTHIIMVVNAKRANAASSNTFINHDAFIVGATTIEN